MEIAIELSEKTLRKFKAYAKLTDKPGSEILDTIAVALDQYITNKILELLEIAPSARVAKPQEFYSSLDLGDGLGDDEVIDPDPEDSFAQMPMPSNTKGVLSDAALAMDMQIEDPDHEAIADGTQEPDQDLLAMMSAVNKQVPARRPANKKVAVKQSQPVKLDQSVDVWGNKRKRDFHGMVKSRVTPLTGEPSSEP